MDLDIHKPSLLPSLMGSNLFIIVKPLSKESVVSVFSQQIHTKLKTLSLTKNTIGPKTPTISDFQSKVPCSKSSDK